MARRSSISVRAASPPSKGRSPGSADDARDRTQFWAYIRARMKDAMISAFDPASTTSASSLVQRLSLSRDALAVVAGGANVRRCVDEMLARGMQADALAVIARALPKRYVVAWACECFKGVLAAQPAANDVDRAGLALTQQWVA